MLLYINIKRTPLTLQAAQQGPPVIGLGWDGLDPNADGQRPLFMTDHPHRSRFVHGPFRSGGVMSGSGRMLAQREIGGR